MNTIETILNNTHHSHTTRRENTSNASDTSLLDIIHNLANAVYNELGTGHSEIVYHKALEVELRINNIQYSTKTPITLEYKGYIVGYSEPDIIIHTEDPIIVELKATTYTPRSSEIAQIHSYMRSTNTSKGILINFPQPTTKTNIQHGVHILSFGFPINAQHDNDAFEQHDNNNNTHPVLNTTIPRISLNYDQ